MSYGDDIIMSDGFEPDEDDEFGTADYDETGLGDDDIEWDTEEH